MYVWGSNERGCLGFTPSIHETNASIPQEDTWVHALDASAPSRPLSAMYTTHARSPVTLADTTSADNVAAAYMEQLASPKAHPFFATSHLPVRHVACGAQHVLVCTYSRVSPVFAWGAGTGFVLGLGDCSDRLTPALVSSFVNMTVHSVQTAGQCSYAIVDRQDMMKALF
ncbi:MAG: hypothetical protein EOO65_02130 [Methanosarcinales archaeon]|nr:MAG: hypothetical protein EOO65_02130 [Methanosarcinales archaeon]